MKGEGVFLTFYETIIIGVAKKPSLMYICNMLPHLRYISPQLSWRYGHCHRCGHGDQSLVNHCPGHSHSQYPRRHLYLSTLLPCHRQSPESISRIIFHRSTTIGRLSPGSIYIRLHYAGSDWFYNRCYSRPHDLYHVGRNYPQLLCRKRSFNHLFPPYRNHFCHPAWPHLKDWLDINVYCVINVSEWGHYEEVSDEGFSLS